MESLEDDETLIEDDELLHIGIIRRSGRYPWGSGGDPYQRSLGFKGAYDELKAKGLSPTEIAEGLGLINERTGKPSTTQLRANIAIATEQIHAANKNRANYLKNTTGMSNRAIANEMGTNESTVRGWLKETEAVKEGSLRATADRLKAEVADKEFLDVGKGTNLYMGVSDTKLRTAVAMLRDEGYEVHPVKIPQLGTDKLTTLKVLTKPGVPWSEANAAVRAGKMKGVDSHSDDNGQTYHVPKSEPVSVNSKRIQVAYKEDGGTAKDGVIELRRGVEDLSLGANRYAQVRVAVDGTHYLKGMAVYADDLPHGVDIRFNTNKSKDDPKIKEEGALGAMKPMKMLNGKIDPDNPFGATTRAHVYVDSKGKEQTSPLRLVNEEGDWDKWSKSLSSQMLSKQSLTLADTQLGKARAAREKDLQEIMSLTNPVVRRKMLEDFAENSDAAAVHLKAAAMDRQATNVILPIKSIRPHEIYAPNFEPGEKVVLVRHPHGGPFEIPELTVNNRNPEARRILGGAKDAVGIHHTVAEKLSGADFDGDTVLVIPNDKGQVKVRRSLKELENFDPKAEYKIPEGDTTTKRMTKKNTQTEMGKISNLITDMTIMKASDAEIANAVRHSMVVIDAEKHGLDYKRSETDHMIKHLKSTYQGGPTKGAATIISRASSADRIPERKQLSGDKGVNPKTGEKVFVPTGNTYLSKKTGKMELKTTKGTKMEFTNDARTLLSGNPKTPLKDRGQPMERIYAAHANSMKSLGNQARKEAVAIKSPKQSAIAKIVYANEIKSLDAKLRLAQKNAPLERRAQAIGNAMTKARIDANPGLDKDDIKKIKFQSLEQARELTGANKVKIGSDKSPLTAREWEAIQAGAISATKLGEILTHADMTRVRELATPRTRTSLSPGQMARARQLESLGRSTADIARELGLPRSTVAENLANA